MLHSLGSNGSGQLGIGHEQDVSVPTECILPGDATPASIATGGNHTIVLTTSGVPLSSGHASDGRCGSVIGASQPSSIGNSTSFSIFVSSESNTDEISTYKHCAATWEASILVTTDGKRIFTCGSGNKGELGQGPGTVTSPQARCILDLADKDTIVVDVSAGMSHAVAVLSDGSVYGWGVGRKGQLGDLKEDSWAPRIINGIPFKAVRAACGREFTYIVSDDKQGQHVVLGTDKWNIRSNAPDSARNWKDIGASWGNIFVLSTSGVLHGWGRDDHGQLPPPGLPAIEKFAAGSEHVIAVSRAGDVLAWGWGEHGNCGIPTTTTGDVTGRCNTLPVPGRVHSVGAGCATSWIW
ncbi:RCC1/BLIP-II [Pseudovirgaria hyperparasitica]|uniref:RCC1/BLIP-II n=1 Tax=Pseudovirgaria hyperparasitica TaxID=470096 RepID=A0A6A6WGA2_9PEZI|nr:RCC1/BLIP-II [Pseudovirgaria hyperparasitica]KAF2761094.1 RCC1/BLIP-II [Pseudovirgaria hyperparasitica]